MKILAIIPARGGSKGIPMKNIRLLNGMPLISYSIRTALDCDIVTDVIVSTDSREIAYVANRYGASVVIRGEELSGDLVTLDPVIYHALHEAEIRNGKQYDVVVTLQATSPLLRTETLRHGIDFLIDNRLDTVISAVNRPHLMWGERKGNYEPLYEKRLNRQELPAQYWESGAFLITKRGCVNPESRIGEKVAVFPTSADEGIDIDDKNDWLLAETILRRRRVLFRMDGYPKLGMGHIYNCITMALSLIEHDVLLVTKADALPGLMKIKETNLPYRVFSTQDELEAIIREYKPDIWVNDLLNTDEEYIEWLKKRVARVVTIEDFGTGTKKADAVINALYPGSGMPRNFYSGHRYVCLREEFQVERPAIFSERVHKVLVMFGGTDPSNLNRKLYKILKEIANGYKDIDFLFVTGLGYDHEGNGIVSCPDKHIFIYPNVQRVSAFMRDADLAITSQGRTIFELAAMGVPAIVLSQNKREQTHVFANMEHGFLNLGVGRDVEPAIIRNTLDWLIRTPAVRRNMYDLMLRTDLRRGLGRVKKIILGDYEDD